MEQDFDPGFASLKYPSWLDQLAPCWIFQHQWPDDNNPHVRNQVLDIIEWLKETYGPPNQSLYSGAWYYRLSPPDGFGGALTVFFYQMKDAAIFRVRFRVQAA